MKQATTTPQWENYVRIQSATKEGAIRRQHTVTHRPMAQAPIHKMKKTTATQHLYEERGSNPPVRKKLEEEVENHPTPKRRDALLVFCVARAVWVDCVASGSKLKVHSLLFNTILDTDNIDVKNE